jgi:hypothetical protein
MINPILFFKAFFALLKSNMSWIIKIVAAFLLPIKPLIGLVFFMILIDTISGIWKSKKLKEEITSRKLSQIISKLVLYEGSLITTFLIDHYLLGELVMLLIPIQFFITKVVAATLVFVEVTSINEKVKAVMGINLWSMFKKMVSRAKEVKKDIGDIIEDDKKEENLPMD